MNRSEHLAWAKKRALKSIETNTITEAWSSFMSDMRKHTELQDHSALLIGTQMLFGGFMVSKKEFVKFLNGFN